MSALALARKRQRVRRLTQTATLRTSVRTLDESGGAVAITTDTAVIGLLSARSQRSAAITTGAGQIDERGAYLWEYPLDAQGRGIDALGRTVVYPFGATLAVKGATYRIVWTPRVGLHDLVGIIGLSES